MIKEHSWVTYLGQKAFVRQYQDHGYFEIIIMEKTKDVYTKMLVSQNDLQMLKNIHGLYITISHILFSTSPTALNVEYCATMMAV